MDIGWIVFYILILVGNLLVATEWAFDTCSLLLTVFA